MSELAVVRGLVVDDDPGKRLLLRVAMEEQGGKVVAMATNAFRIVELVEAGEVTPAKVDVAFVDSNLGSSYGDGKEVLRFLNIRGLIREDFNFTDAKLDGFVPVPDPDKIVTVGCSNEEDWAREIGSYSDVLQQPLTVDWQPDIDLTAILAEVRRLKQLG